MEKLKTLNFNKLFIIYILIQPILDILTSLFVRNISSGLTIGVFVRTIFMVIIALYSLSVLNKKNRIKLFVCYALLAIYSIIYIIICYLNTGINMILIEIKGLVKALYLPVVLVGLFSLYKSKKIEINIKHLIYALFVYCLVIVLAKYFNIGYYSYLQGYKPGTVGLFLAANEIGAILAIISPYLFIKISNTKNNNFYMLTYILLTCSVLEIGTKVPFLAFMVLLIINFIINLYRLIILKEKSYIKNLGVFLISIVFIAFIIGITPIGENLNINFISNKDEFNSSNTDNISGDDNTDPSENEFIEGDITSGRTAYFETNIQEYINSEYKEELFGTSYLTVDNGDIQEKKLVEMDFFDIFFNHGLIGFVLILGYILSLTIYIIFNNLKQFKKILKQPERLLYLYAYFIGLAISFMSGHVLTSPAVSIFIIISLILNVQLIDSIEVKE